MRVLVSLLLFVSLSARAQDLGGFERILIPFKGADVTGIGGSRFRAGGAAIARGSYRYWPYCDFSSTTPAFGRVDDPTGFGVSMMCAGGSRGRVLFVEKGASDKIALGYTIDSVAADADAPVHHVSIPLARERDFRKSTFQIVVPAGSGRVTVRVYEVNGRTDAAVRVTLRASVLGWARVRDELILDLTGREGTDPSYPAFAEAPLDLNCFVTSPRLCVEWNAAVEIEPLTEGEFWAIVSRTDNRTQQITLFWPQ